MAREFRLQSLLDLSQMRLEDATRQLGELIASQEQASGRLAVLIQYRDEYQARFIEAARGGLGRDAWQNYGAFIDRLDAAIAQARELVAASERRTAAGQQEWLAKRGKVKAFNTLAERHQAREQYTEQRQEQKALDEHTSQRFKKEEAS
ncbi:Flagellar FliJ protein [Rhodocyclaceae bacterium]|nr:Flagellar FliJ protein [Rhodocyclaceae bacterium]